MFNKMKKAKEIVKENKDTIMAVGFFAGVTFAYTLVAQLAVNTANRIVK